ncbi:MAG: hypothetical protein DRP10_03900 [Candidatus Aenigmatarchaeota archaeon]|nr:MAG: hypothetical protein DRP10_03900 [Candidatus Aenigmarchaeota archaeon]
MRKYTRYRKLTEEEINEIRRRQNAGEPDKKISKDLGIPYYRVRCLRPEVREKMKRRQEENYYRKLNSYFKEFETILKLVKNGDIKDTTYLFPDFLQNPFSLIIKSLGPYKQKLKTIRKSIEEKCDDKEIFERDGWGNLKIISYVHRLENKKLIECEVWSQKIKLYYLSEEGKEIYNIITQLESFS